MSKLPFVLIIPGMSFINDFKEHENMYFVELPNPSQIKNLSIFLSQSIPENYGISVFFTFKTIYQMEYIGSISNQRPSDIFPTGFALRPQPKNHSTVTIIIKALSYEQISPLIKVNDGQCEYAKLVAQNLHNFMMSYHKEGMIINNPQGQEYMAIPSDVFGKWVSKFQLKYRLDPNFILKTTVEK